ncbi:hypothetical protein L1887_57841 [Cichorium endivia]|nr:hypothetical protein L1887_57841 [Cichorium endivia]
MRRRHAVHLPLPCLGTRREDVLGHHIASVRRPNLRNGSKIDSGSRAEQSTGEQGIAQRGPPQNPNLAHRASPIAHHSRAPRIKSGSSSCSRCCSSAAPQWTPSQIRNLRSNHSVIAQKSSRRAITAPSTARSGLLISLQATFASPLPRRDPGKAPRFLTRPCCSLPLVEID